MSNEYFAYIGTFLRPERDAIHIFRYDVATGRLTPAGVFSTMFNPSYFVMGSPTLIYSVSDSNLYGQSEGAVAAYDIDLGTGALKLRNMATTGFGGYSCHLALDKEGRHLYVANYGGPDGGSMTGFDLEADGSIGKQLFNIRRGKGAMANPQRQEGSHVHCLAFTMDGKRICAADLGTDRVEVYRHDAASGMVEWEQSVVFKPGMGPRHLAFHPNGKYGYVVCETGSEIMAMRYDSAAGKIEAIQTMSTLPEDFKGANTCGAVRVSPDGRFVYSTNRGLESIARYSVDEATGKLTLLSQTPSGGKSPRDIVFSPDGRFLFAAHENSEEVVRFAIDQKTGSLSRDGEPTVVPNGSCVCFLKAN